MNVTFANDTRPENKFKKKATEIFNKVKTWKLPNAFYYFLILVCIGIGFYFIMLIENGFSLAYGGDYSAQYIPMGYHVWDYYHEWMKTGEFALFDQNIYLGVNSIGSNAYYGLFSPFNIIIVLLPRSFVPQSMAICSIIKLACAGLFFSMYMKRAFGVKDVVARTCGIAYGFAGWGAFYLWYNNYQDILVFFPIILLGIERVLKTYKPWTLCTGVFFLAICNYVLAIPYLICSFIYAMFRFFQMIRTKNVADNFKTLGFGIIGFGGGLLMSMLIFGPAVMATINSPKLDSYSYFGTLKGYLTSGKLKEFFELLFSWKVAPDQHGSKLPTRVLYPILEFFFPATTCRSLPTIQLQSWDFDDMSVSLWCYIPFIMFMVPALIQSGKEKKWSHYIAFALLVLSLFTPFMYFATMGFTNGYARWTLFIASSLIAYVGIYLDKIPNVSKWHIHVGFAFAITGIIVTWILTEKLSVANTNTYGKYMHRLYDYDLKFDFTTLAFILELCYTLGVYLTFFFFYHKKAFHVLATIFVSFEAIVMGNLVTWGHGYDTCYNHGYAMNERFRDLMHKATKNDGSFYRIYSSNNDDYSVNNNMMNGYSSGDYFHSLYNFEVNDFTLWTGLRDGNRSVGGHYRGKYQDVDALLGVKYYFVGKAKSKYKSIEKYNPNGYIANTPFGFEERTELNTDKTDFVVYENKNFADFGHTYDTIFDEKLWTSNVEDTVQHGAMLMTNAYVPEKDAQEIEKEHSDITLNTYMPSYSNILTQLRTDQDYKIDYYDLWTGAGEDAMFYGYGGNKDNGYDYRLDAYDFGKIANIPNTFSPVTYDRTWLDDKGNAYGAALHHYAFYSSPTPGEPLFRAGTALYVRGRNGSDYANDWRIFSNSIKYNFLFLDENGKVFMFDSHDDDTTDNTAQLRGFYIKKDVYQMAVCGKYGNSYFVKADGGEKLQLFIESQTAFEERATKVSSHPIENLKCGIDRFTFETHYTDKERFVVSYVAYDSGWKIKARYSDGRTENLKLYNGNGGFVSFVAPKGDVTYEMTYTTPYLVISYIVSALAVTSFFVSMVGYTIYQNKKKQHYVDGIYRENY